MDFLKKFLGKKEGAKSNEGQATGEDGFVCETCGQERSESQRKAHTAEHGAQENGEKKNVCEFC